MPRELDAVAGARTAVGPVAGPFAGRQRSRWPSVPRSVLAVVFAGGVGGGLARYAVTSVWPTPVDRFPWATFAVNTTGTFALALLLVVLADLGAKHRYTRALLGTGFLGAFTTFSAVTVSVDQLLTSGHRGSAAGYLALSVVAALGAGLVGVLLGRALPLARQRPESRPRPQPRQRGRLPRRR